MKTYGLEIFLFPVERFDEELIGAISKAYENCPAGIGKNSAVRKIFQEFLVN